MLRLTLATRLTLIILVALIAVWILAIAAYYRSLNLNGSLLPAPQRIASFVELVERVSPEHRQLLLQATTTPTFVPAIAESGGDRLPSGVATVTETIARPYAEALGGRDLVIVSRPASALAQRFPRVFGTEAGGGAEFRIGLPMGETLIITAKQAAAVSRFGVPFGFGAGLLGTLIALVALVLMYRETRPLAQLAATVDRIDLTGDVSTLPRTTARTPEIRALIAAFDRLLRRLDGMVRGRMVLLAGISHDVRTFATRLRLRVDNIADDDERERAITDISDMIGLLDDALVASRASACELQQELVDLDALVRAEVCDRQAQGAGITYRADHGCGELLVLADRVALKRIIANATDNALKYGRAAHLATAIEDGAAVVMIDDEGPGIPVEQRALMLEPFTRLEQSRSRSTGGTGLGLAVIRHLTEAHGGSVEIGTAPIKGARLVICLPLFAEGDTMKSSLS